MKTGRSLYPLSLTPRFSGVLVRSGESEPFQRFGRAGLKPLKRFSHLSFADTQLKLGANETAESNGGKHSIVTSHQIHETN